MMPRDASCMPEFAVVVPVWPALYIVFPHQIEIAINAKLGKQQRSGLSGRLASLGIMGTIEGPLTPLVQSQHYHIEVVKGGP